jgi:hypothetical protein
MLQLRRPPAPQCLGWGRAQKIKGCKRGVAAWFRVWEYHQHKDPPPQQQLVQCRQYMLAASEATESDIRQGVGAALAWQHGAVTTGNRAGGMYRCSPCHWTSHYSLLLVVIA